MKFGEGRDVGVNLGGVREMNGGKYDQNTSYGILKEIMKTAHEQHCRYLHPVCCFSMFIAGKFSSYNTKTNLETFWRETIIW